MNIKEVSYSQHMGVSQNEGCGTGSLPQGSVCFAWSVSEVCFGVCFGKKGTPKNVFFQKNDKSMMIMIPLASNHIKSQFKNGHLAN